MNAETKAKGMANTTYSIGNVNSSNEAKGPVNIIKTKEMDDITKTKEPDTTSKNKELENATQAKQQNTTFGNITNLADMQMMELRFLL